MALLTIPNTVKQPREQNHRSNRPLLPRPSCYYDGVAIYMRVRRKALVDREPYVRVMRHSFGSNVFAARVVDYNAQPGDVDVYGGHSRGFRAVLEACQDGWSWGTFQSGLFEHWDTQS